MSKITIPATTIIKCDFCGREKSSQITFIHGGELIVHQHALDYQGNPCADATYKKDVCDDCLYALNHLIENLIKERIK